MRIVILAAGVGSRLGNPFPKPLTPLADGQTIMARQMEAIAANFSIADVITVVGFKKDMVMEAFPRVSYAYNQDFGETNTSKSLLRGLELSGPDSVLWMNGDVVLDPAVLATLRDHIAADRSFVCVNTASVGEEEVKYRADDQHRITELSKQVVDAQGEAVGINFVSASDKPMLMKRLDDCAPDDYFERGIEFAVERDGVTVYAVDVGQSLCIEVDFPEDLARANEAIRGRS